MLSKAEKKKLHEMLDVYVKAEAQVIACRTDTEVGKALKKRRLAEAAKAYQDLMQHIDLEL